MLEKRDCVSLRDKIILINKDINDGIYSKGGEMTVLELVKKYISQKQELDIIHKPTITLLSISLLRNHLVAKELTKLSYHQMPKDG